jgi:hypothetical protein
VAEPALLCQDGRAHDEQRSEGGGKTGGDREGESEQGQNSDSASSRRHGEGSSVAQRSRQAPTERQRHSTARTVTQGKVNDYSSDSGTITSQ